MKARIRENVMTDPMEELRATATRLKRESDELLRKIDALQAHAPNASARADLGEGDIVRIATRAVELFEQQHPRPTHVTQMQAAEMLGISRWTVSKMVRAGALKLNRCGLIPIELIDRARSGRECK